jgi:hypothetical protein
MLLMPGIDQGERSERAEPPHLPVADGAGEEGASHHEDDVLEIIEERIVQPTQIAAASPLDPLPPADVVRPVRWGRTDGSSEDGQATALADWRQRLEESRGLLAARGGLLGLRLAEPSRTLPPLPIAPDPALFGGELSPFDALFSPVRGVLRAIVLAAEGRSPSLDALAGAGDLAWLLHRARALALIVKCDLVGARDAVQMLPEDASPEGHWAKDRLLRYGPAREVRADPEEARLVAANLIADLGHQLGRTIAGTVAGTVRGDRGAGREDVASRGLE